MKRAERQHAHPLYGFATPSRVHILAPAAALLIHAMTAVASALRASRANLASARNMPAARGSRA